MILQMLLVGLKEPGFGKRWTIRKRNQIFSGKLYHTDDRYLKVWLHSVSILKDFKFRKFYEKNTGIIEIIFIQMFCVFKIK